MYKNRTISQRPNLQLAIFCFKMDLDVLQKILSYVKKNNLIKFYQIESYVKTNKIVKYIVYMGLYIAQIHYFMPPEGN